MRDVCRRAHRGRDAQAAQDRSRAALHAAAAALHRGVAGQGARREGHRPPVDLRQHPVDDPGPRLRREDAKGASIRPTLGTMVNDLLVESFPDILDVTFTAQMEDELDQVEEGAADWVEAARRLLRAVQGRPRQGGRAHARPQARGDPDRASRARSAARRWSSSGAATASSSPAAAIPSARTRKEFMRDAKTAPSRSRPSRRPTRSARPAARRCWSSAGASASSSPARAIPTARPRGRSRSASPARGPNCGGFLTEKRSRRGKVFFGCSNYAKTQCDFVLWDRPIPEKCPQCGATFLVKRENRRGGGRIRCVAEGCGYTQDLGGGEAGEGGEGEGGATGDAA